MLIETWLHLGRGARLQTDPLHILPLSQTSARSTSPTQRSGPSGCGRDDRAPEGKVAPRPQSSSLLYPSSLYPSSLSSTEQFRHFRFVAALRQYPPAPTPHHIRVRELNSATKNGIEKSSLLIHQIISLL